MQYLGMQRDLRFLTLFEMTTIRILYLLLTNKEK